MTLTEFQKRLHYLYQGDTDVPTSGDEYDLRTELLSDAIDTWSNEEGILWFELWTMLSDSATGDKTITAANRDYDCPTDFKFPGGIVTINDGTATTRVEVIPMQNVGLYGDSDVTKCYFTGNAKVGHSIHFLFQPTVGATIEYPYYKTPFKPTSGSDVIEMSDPTFAIQSALQIMLEHSGAGDRANLALAKASAKLQGMRTANMMPTWFGENSVPDRDYSNGVRGFGR
jgi:hypothetical protein